MSMPLSRRRSVFFPGHSRRNRAELLSVAVERSLSHYERQNGRGSLNIVIAGAVVLGLSAYAIGLVIWARATR